MQARDSCTALQTRLALNLPPPPPPARADGGMSPDALEVSHSMWLEGHQPLAAVLKAIAVNTLPPGAFVAAVRSAAAVIPDKRLHALDAVRADAAFGTCGHRLLGDTCALSEATMQSEIGQVGWPIKVHGCRNASNKAQQPSLRN